MCCCAIASIPPPEKVTPDTPLRLGIAAALAFPDGSMTASGLRREGARGRLTIERIAGKDYTTLANIERMRELCRVEAKVPGCGFGNVADENRFGSSETGAVRKARGVLHTILSERNELSPPTSPASTSEGLEEAAATPNKSRSQTS
jgi:hypothetical protein